MGNAIFFTHRLFDKINCEFLPVVNEELTKKAPEQPGL
jgi:hypothetical protein